MGITIEFGEQPEVKLTKPQERALRTTLEVAESVRRHIEDLQAEDIGHLPNGSATLLLADGLAEFVETYAPEQKTDERERVGKQVGSAGEGEAGGGKPDQTDQG